MPPELIGTEPFFPKEQTKMLVYDGAKILDVKLINLLDFLQENDVLVFNDARVIKAKLSAKILRSDIAIELNLDQEISKKLWQAIVRGSRKIKDGDLLEIASDFFAKVVKKLEDGFILLEFADDNYLEKLAKYGSIPLPPYIKRDLKEDDEKNYQTIYAQEGLAVAAPTAGLHFTDKIFAMLRAKKIQMVFVTLNVGAGTFMPVRSELLQDHKMHQESFSISAETAQIINEARARKSKIVAVGTTSLRVLESVADENGNLREMQNKTNIFIYPPYKFKVVDVLMTNFHLPKSTLFMLISAFIGKEKAQEVYSHAIQNNYRFYSYGDSSLLFRNDKIS